MHLKKKLVSLALAAALLASVPVSALASPAFNSQVLDGYNDIIINNDDITGVTYIQPSAILGYTLMTRPTAHTAVAVEPYITLTDPADFFDIKFHLHGYDRANLNMIAIKIGDNRYIFSNCTYRFSLYDDGTSYESIILPIKKETLPFMNDFVTHKNDEIKVRLIGSFSQYDFVLSDAMKNAICELYNLYISAGALSQPNFNLISAVDETIVTRNGTILS